MTIPYHSAKYMQRMQRQSPVFIREVTVSMRQERWWWQSVLSAKLEESTRSDGDRVTDHRGQERFPGRGDLTAHSWRDSRNDIGRKGRERKMATGKRNDVTIYQLLAVDSQLQQVSRSNHPWFLGSQNVHSCWVLLLSSTLGTVMPLHQCPAINLRVSLST